MLESGFIFKKTPKEFIVEVEFSLVDRIQLRYQKLTATLWELLSLIVEENGEFKGNSWKMFLPYPHILRTKRNLHIASYCLLKVGKAHSGVANEYLRGMH